MDDMKQSVWLNVIINHFYFFLTWDRWILFLELLIWEKKLLRNLNEFLFDIYGSSREIILVGYMHKINKRERETEKK